MNREVWPMPKELKNKRTSQIRNKHMFINWSIRSVPSGAHPFLPQQTKGRSLHFRNKASPSVSTISMSICSFLLLSSFFSIVCPTDLASSSRLRVCFGCCVTFFDISASSRAKAKTSNVRSPANSNHHSRTLKPCRNCL